jgi:cystathionine gamma-synthase
VVLSPRVDVRVFYDALELCKGPSLGTCFTLVCPYTLLAHYHELDWAAQFGVSAQLIRVSVGLEPLEDLVAHFSLALAAAAAPASSSSLSEI